MCTPLSPPQPELRDLYLLSKGAGFRFSPPLPISLPIVPFVRPPRHPRCASVRRAAAAAGEGPAIHVRHGGECTPNTARPPTLSPPAQVACVVPSVF